MKRKIAALLTFVMVLCTCMNAMAASYSVKWSQDANGNWQILANGVAAKNAWIYDDECDTPGGIYYLVDENGKLVVAPLVLDGEGHYYSFSDQHDGHYGEMITKSGRYYGVDLVFDANHNGGFGSITNADGIAKLAAKYGVKEMPNIKNSSTVKLSEVNKASSDGGSQDYVASYKVSFNVNHNNATPSTYEAQTVKRGEKAVKPASPSDLNEVLVFKGWTQTMDGLDYFDFENTGVTRDMTLYARWGLDGYIVDYDGNGADNPEAEPEDENIYKAGDFVTILSPGTLSREGFVFKEWNTQRDGSGNGYKAGETIMIFEDKQFYAIWDVKPEANYLTFTAEQANSTVTIGYKSGTDVKYSTDGGTTWLDAPDGTTVTLAAVGDSFCMKGKGFVTGYDNVLEITKSFAMTGKIKASGSVTSLLDETGVNENVTLAEGCFSNMFEDCDVLTQAPVLPAKNLSFGCYAGMFECCTSLTKMPELPATTLAMSCYSGMFSGCTALNEVTTLPATTLADYCYSSMFEECESLTAAPALTATSLKEGCYKEMFAYCTAMTTAPALPATAAADWCYYAMFAHSGLTTAPVLPATTLGEHCYGEMFYDCKELTTVPLNMLPATSLELQCYVCMFYDCTKLNTVPALPATTLAGGCYDQMFSGCTALNRVPALPAVTLQSSCYSQMFSGCTGLKVYAATGTGHAVEWRIPTTGTGTAPTYALANMFTGTIGSRTNGEINTTYYVEYAPVALDD